ncbi:unnamed protein product, partial [Discosporangium mesarthrocarpum]
GGSKSPGGELDEFWGLCFYGTPGCFSNEQEGSLEDIFRVLLWGSPASMLIDSTLKMCVAPGVTSYFLYALNYLSSSNPMWLFSHSVLLGVISTPVLHSPCLLVGCILASGLTMAAC